jgi:hypothetical protein
MDGPVFVPLPRFGQILVGLDTRICIGRPAGHMTARWPEFTHILQSPDVSQPPTALN